MRHCIKKSPEVSARKVAFTLIGWLIITNALVWLAHSVGGWPSQVVLFVCLAFLPGTALLRIMRIALRTFSARVVYSFGLSVLVLMLSGLIANEVLYAFGVARPLELWGILGTWDTITGLLIIAGIFTNRTTMRLKQWPAKGFSKTAWLFLALSLLLPGLAAMGAFRLNNGGDALFAELTLGYAAGLMAYVFILRKRLPNELLAWFIFIIGLSVLLMTSLRGWDITGHDIEREFRVYTLTHLHGRWNIGLDRDPYNACLSITILPEMFAKLLNISGLLVFKVILQVIFAVCPVAVFILLRQYVSKLGALVGSMLFICYPTFITDSAMLTRQGVAYLFFALALLVVSNQAQRKRYKFLFSLCALGAVLSHYSTAYMFVALFAVAAVCKLLVTWWQQRGHWSLRPHMQPTVLSLLFTALLFLMTFVWYTQITATTGGLVRTFHQSFENIPKLFSSDNSNKSSDTSAALVSGGAPSQASLYNSYLTKTQYSSTAVTASSLQFIPTLVSDDLPLTSLGKKVHKLGVDPSLINTLRQNFAKVLQVLALLGVVYVATRLLRRKPDTFEPDFIYLNVAGIILLILMVLLPVLSVNYGILRAFQQILIFLILPIMLLLIRIARPVANWLATAISTLGMVLLFLLFTGLFGQILGGVSPPLSLNNQGLYFGLYYSPKADTASFTWIKQHIPSTGDVRAANFNRAIMHDSSYPFSKPGILPSQIAAKSFVYLDPAQIQQHVYYTYFQSSPLTMSFPLDYYDNTMNQIYSTTSTRIYR